MNIKLSGNLIPEWDAQPLSRKRGFTRKDTHPFVAASAGSGTGL